MTQAPKRTFSIEAMACPDADHYMTTRDACWYTGFSRRSFEQRLDDIPHYRVGRKLLFKKSELDEWLQQYKQPSATTDLKTLADEAADAVLKDPE